jgi:alkylated DNA repair dioxygenase AlkB
VKILIGKIEKFSLKNILIKSNIKNYKMATHTKTDLSKNAYILYYPDFVEDDTLYDTLVKTVPWEQGVYNMFGKPVKTPRLLYAMKDKGDDITKEYDVTGSMEFIPEIQSLKDKIEKELKTNIRYAQLNYYRDGADYIGWHTDSEVADGDFIASVSLGWPRKFVLRGIKDKTDKYRLTLEDKSLLVMNDYAAKKEFKHTLTKSSLVKGGRINITFRPR